MGNTLSIINLYEIARLSLIYLKKKYYIMKGYIKRGVVLMLSISFYDHKILHYFSIFGLCIGINKLKIMSSFYIRNVLGSIICNLKIYFHQPLLTMLRASKVRMIPASKSKLYHITYPPFLFRINKGIGSEFKNFFKKNKNKNKNI